MADNKNRKYNRNSDSCTVYTTQGRRVKNKVLKIFRHLRKQPNDDTACKALVNLGVDKEKVRKYALTYALGYAVRAA